MSQPHVFLLVKLFLMITATTVVLQVIVSPLGRRLAAEMRRFWRRDVMEVAYMTPEEFRRRTGTDSDKLLIIVAESR